MKLVARLTLLLMLLGFAQGALVAQDVSSYALTADVNGTEIMIPARGAYLTDDNAVDGEYYAPGTDRTVTLTRMGPCVEGQAFCLSFSDFDIAPEDTLFFYDGPSTSSPLLLRANNRLNNLSGDRTKVFISPSNASTSITVRFKVSGSSSQYRGFVCEAVCEKPCESTNIEINPIFYRARNGVIYDSAHVIKDTLEGGATVDCINLCFGDELVLSAQTEYSRYHGYYYPDDSTTKFIWDMGIDRNPPVGLDTFHIYGNPMLKTSYYADTTGCYDIILYTVDEFNCKSNGQTSVRVRVATSPIKTIVSELPVFCSSDSLRIIIGVDEARSHLVLDTMHRAEIVSRMNDSRAFIPDGCANSWFSSPVTFTEFPNGATITSEDEICSICVNMEHSWAGDFEMQIYCPSGRHATLKYGRTHPNNIPTGGFGPSSELYLGAPYGGSHDGYGDGGGSTCTPQDSLYNMPGVGFDYCFSRNGAYTLVDGNPANTAANGNHYLGNTQYTIDTTITFPNPPSYMRGSITPAGTQTFTTKRPSKYADKTDYYKPADRFTGLIGCPLNGTWEIRLKDDWGSDNGWVFGWSMDICNVSDNRDCKYDVGIDSVRWNLDSSGGAYRDGKYYGPIVHRQNDSISYALMVDTSGVFPLAVYVYDDFGCRWDTSTTIRSIWAPQPDLGPDQYACKDATVDISVYDRTTNASYTYVWEPNGETSTSITSGPAGDAKVKHKYVIISTNNEDSLVQGCVGRDSMYVIGMEKPLPNFDASIYPMEGCAPLTEVITNHSQYTDTYHWEFSDGFVSDDPEPTHTFSAGVYDIKYYVSNAQGCKDSLILPGIVNVYATPRADFVWEPTYPTVRNPFINLENQSMPTDIGLQYQWEIQYNKDNIYSFQTLTEESPTYTWNLGDEQDAGKYSVKLIAINENMAPSGTVFRCSDTTEGIVLLINDFLQFPNVVTANGDGTNDKFIIKNLANGWAYPINELNIYNRWGARIFHAENIDSEDDFWDPAATHSPTGTYFFHFTARGLTGVIERRGAVEVIR